jgi:hypothetical protein
VEGRTAPVQPKWDPKVNPAELLRAALLLRLLNQRQVNECLSKYRRAGGARPMEEILLDGYLNRKQVERARNHILGRVARPVTKRIARRPVAARSARTAWIFAATGLVVVAGVIAAIVAIKSSEPQPPPVSSQNGNDSGGTAPTPPPGPADAGPQRPPTRPPDQEGREPVLEWFTIQSDGEVASQWNALAQRAPARPEFDQIGPLLRQISELSALAGGSNHPCAADIARLLAQAQARKRWLQEREWQETRERAQGFLRERRYGKALEEYEFFPLTLDDSGEFRRRVEGAREEVLRQARADYEKIEREVDEAVARGDFERAKSLIDEALAFGIEQISERAHGKREEISRAETSGRREEAERRIRSLMEARRSAAQGMSLDELLERAERLVMAGLRAGASAGADRVAEAAADLALYVERGGRLDARFQRTADRVARWGPYHTVVLDMYERALERDAAQPHALAGLAGLLVALGRPDDALQRVLRAPREALSPSIAQWVVSAQLLERSPARRQVSATKYQRGHYEIWTDGSPDRARAIAQEMERHYADYERVFPYPHNDVFVFRVLVFRDRRGFDQYRQDIFRQSDIGSFGRTEAFYWPATKELVLYEGGIGAARHEAFHQFLDFYVDDAPLWFNEGFASYFETSEAGRPRLNEQRLREYWFAAPEEVKRTPMEQVMTMSPEAWHGGGRAVFWYGVSWSLVYYFMTHDGEDLLREYFFELVEGRDARAAYDRVFRPRATEYERGWRAWLEEERTRILGGRR